MSRAWFLLAAAVVTSGCLPQLEAVEITPETTPPQEAKLSGNGVILAQGNAVAVYVKAFDDTDDVVDTEVTAAADPGLTVYKREYPSSIEESTEFIFAGEEVGTGKIRFSVRDKATGSVSVPFTITAPE